MAEPPPGPEPELPGEPPPEQEPLPRAEPPPLEPERILFRGEGLLAYDKPSGLPVHLGTGHPFGLAEILDAWARAHPGEVTVGPGWRVAPLHRLDLEASGVVLLGLNRKSSSAIQEAFAGGRIGKRYLAVVAGPLEEEAAIEGQVRQKLGRSYRYMPSRLEYRRLEGDERLSLVEVIPEGGRTHQIRALFAGIDRPLAGDLRYGKPRPARQFLERFGVAHLLLHAFELVLPAGVPGGPRTLRAPLPESFRKVACQKGWPAQELPPPGRPA